MRSFKIFIQELENTGLDYHDELNPKLWTHNEGRYALKPEVMDAINKIADRFIEALKVPHYAIKNVVLTGSNCNYNWTKLSDIDIHLLVDLSGCDGCSIDIEDCMQAKKSLWNAQHEVSIYGHPVELYATTQPEHLVGAAGAYSLMNQDWIQIPPHEKFSYNSEIIKKKADEIAKQIDHLVDSSANDYGSLRDLNVRIGRLRQSGLEKGGEFGLENLVFKTLRNNGYIDKLRKQIVNAEDHDLSLRELLDLHAK
jgi:hypothetical protein